MFPEHIQPSCKESPFCQLIDLPLKNNSLYLRFMFKNQLSSSVTDVQDRTFGPS